MSVKKDGSMIVLSSPSGAGKTTLVKKLASALNSIISISYTTRVPRAKEINGKDYFFIKDEEFKKLIQNDELLEYARVFENFYGTSKLKVREELEKGKNVLFDIDWQGTEQIKQKNLKYSLITFFILPPSKKTLLGRLSERENNNEKVVNSRMKNFEKDLIHWSDYDYVVINDELNICLDEILSTVMKKLKNEKVIYDKSKIEDHVKKLLS